MLTFEKKNYLLWFFLIILWLFLLSFWWQREKGQKLGIKSENGWEEYDMSLDRIIVISGPLGETSIEIKGGKARFIKSPCPDKTCINTGWLVKKGDIGICLPNKIAAELR